MAGLCANYAGGRVASWGTHQLVPALPVAAFRAFAAARCRLAVMPAMPVRPRVAFALRT